MNYKATRQRIPIPRFNIEPSSSNGNKNQQSLIYLVYRYGKKDANGKYKRLKYSIREYVLTDLWNNKMQQATVTAAHPYYSNLNDKINDIKKEAKRIVRENSKISIESFKLKLDQFLGEPIENEVLPPTLFEYWEVYYKKEKDKYKASDTWKKFRQILNHVKKFAEDKRENKLDFDDIDMNFRSDFIDWSRRVKNHSENTISKSIEVIKQIMSLSFSDHYIDHEGIKKPIHNNPIHNNKKFKLDRIKTTTLYPTLQELNVLLNYRFDTGDEERDKKLALIKDVYLISAFGGGLRWSDITNLTKDNYYVDPVTREEHLHVFTYKGRNTKKDNEVFIPINEVLQSLLDKYNFKFQTFNSQYVNNQLKEIFLMAGLTRQESKKSGIKDAEIEQVRLCDEVSFHTARYAYINYMINDFDVSIEKLKSITGQSYKVLLGYQKDDKKKNARKVNEQTKGLYRSLRIIKKDVG